MTKEKVKEIIYSNTPLDSITDMYQTKEFTEVTGKAGGDTLTFRVYENGTITERQGVFLCWKI